VGGNGGPWGKVAATATWVSWIQRWWAISIHEMSCFRQERRAVFAIPGEGEGIAVGGPGGGAVAVSPSVMRWTLEPRCP